MDHLERSQLANLLHPLSKFRKHCGGTDGQVVLPSFVFPFAVPTSIAKPDYHSHCVPNTVSAEEHQQIYSIPLGSGRGCLWGRDSHQRCTTFATVMLWISIPLSCLAQALDSHLKRFR